MTAPKTLIAALVALGLLPLAAGNALGAGKSASHPELRGKEQLDHMSSSQPEATPLARESVIVDGRVIYLGDLFLNAGKHANKAVAYAPAPGERAIFDARWLYRVARAYRLKWRPLTMKQQIVVERTSQVIERAEIEDTIMAALFDKGANPASQLELNTRLDRLHVASNVQATVGVDDVSYDPRSKRFTAVLSAPANDPRGRKIRLTGRVHGVVQIPVPARAISRGDIIGKRDIKWIRVRADQVLPDTINKSEDLIDMAAKRGLRTDALVRQSDVERPILVERGSMVTVILSHGTMSLTAQGKALEKGAKGDTIRMINKRSNSVFEGIVSGLGQAKVRLFAHQELAQSNPRRK